MESVIKKEVELFIEKSSENDQFYLKNLKETEKLCEYAKTIKSEEYLTHIINLLKEESHSNQILEIGIATNINPNIIIQALKDLNKPKLIYEYLIYKTKRDITNQKIMPLEEYICEYSIKLNDINLLLAFSTIKGINTISFENILITKFMNKKIDFKILLDYLNITSKISKPKEFEVMFKNADAEYYIMYALLINSSILASNNQTIVDLYYMYIENMDNISDKNKKIIESEFSCLFANEHIKRDMETEKRLKN